jgi:hypothetical protein
MAGRDLPNLKTGRLFLLLPETLPLPQITAGAV